MPKFRKKPVEIEAFRALIDKPPLWFKAAIDGGVVVHFLEATKDGSYYAIETLEGIMRAERGDWIIRGVKGELYPCKPDIFEATYLSVENDAPLTDEWLASVGFKWSQFERQPSKHWLLWLGDSVGQGRMTSYEDLGIEVASMAYRNHVGDLVGDRDGWFCWLRSDAAGRYHRFLHVRHIKTQADLIRLVKALTGQDWNPETHLYGSVRTPEQAAKIRVRDEDLDRRLVNEGHPWADIERDDTRGRALPEHMEAHEKAKEGKAG